VTPYNLVKVYTYRTTRRQESEEMNLTFIVLRTSNFVKYLECFQKKAVTTTVT